MSGKTFNLETMSLQAMDLEDLWALHETIRGILSTRIRAEKRELEKRLAILSRSLDRTAPAINQSAGVRTRRSYPAVLPKYRNPQTSETWSGRGKRPRWLIAAMKSGHKIEEFRINEVVGTRGGQRT